MKQEQIDAILDDLSEEYGPFIMMIYSRFDTPSVADIESLLLMQEAQIEKFKADLSPVIVSINVAQGPNSNSSNGSNNSDSYNSNKGLNEYENNRGRGSYRGRGGRNNNGNGRGQGSYGLGPKPTCQLCFKNGHDAFNCWNHFDENFVEPPPPPPTTAEQAHPYGFQNYQVPTHAGFQNYQGPQNVGFSNFQGPQGGPSFNFQGSRPQLFNGQHARAYVATQTKQVQGHTQEVQVRNGLDSQT